MSRLVKLTLVCATLALAIMAGCGQANTPQAAIGVRINLQTEPLELAVGQSTLIITLQDGSGAALDGATVQAHGDMDHAGMTPLDAQTNASSTGIYRIPFTWTMGGGWVLTVTAQLPNGSIAKETFHLNVSAVSSESIINQPAGHS